MRRLLLPLVLAGCASVSTNEAPCACIIHVSPEDMNGIVALQLDGEQLAFADFPDQRLPVLSGLSASSEYFPHDRLSLQHEHLFTVQATFAPGFDVTQPVGISELHLNEIMIAGADRDRTARHDLGPEGGTLRVEEIVPEADGGYRLRGGFSAQICPSDETASQAACQELQGRFAFSQDDLPEGADFGNLLAGSS